MKRYILILVLLIISKLIYGQNNDLLWISHFTGTGQNQPYMMTSDNSGNYYVCGNFTGTVSQGAFSLTTFGGQDIFLIKYSKAGQVIWMKQIGGLGGESVWGLALSKDNNYLYVAGQFPAASPTVDFDGFTIANTGSIDVFLAKYNVDGTYEWAHNTAYGATLQANGSITVDNDDNIVQVGVFTTGVTFYGGVIGLADGSGVRQNFMAKYDSDGNTLWAKQIQGDDATTFVRTVSAYEYGYFFSGQYKNNLNLDIGIITSAGGTLDGFIYKTDLDGNGLFVRKISGSGDDYLYRHKSDENGYQFIAGYYNSPTLTVDSLTGVSSAMTYPNAGSNDIFFSSYAPDGSLQFAKRFGTAGDDQGLAIMPSANKVLLGGVYTGNINFDSFNLVNSASDAFMLETDRYGNVLSTKRAFGIGNEQASSANTDIDNCNLFVGEFYSNTLNIDGSMINNAGGGTRDMFLAKFGTITLTYSTTNVSCYGLSDGAIDITVTGNGTAPYSYSWTGPGGFTSTSEDLTGIEAGQYDVTVTDALGAVKTGNTTINQPSPVLLFFDVKNTACPSSADGEINLSVLGGTLPYTYTWSGGEVTEDLTALAAGTYDVTVTDANNCSATGSATVSNPAGMLLFSSVTNTLCPASSDGAIDLSVVNGVSPYTYSWSGGDITEDISGLSAGSYSVTVTDGNGCTATTSANVANPAAMILSASVIIPSCVPGADGSVDLSVVNGAVPYTFLWSSSDITEDISSLISGVYSVTVTDNNLCTATASYNVANPAAPSLIAVSTNPSCIPGNDGTIDVIVSGGTLPYSFVWSDGPVTTEDRTGLSAGTYSVTVTDAASCSTTSNNINITNPVNPSSLIVSVNPSCVPDNDGSVDLNVFSGTPPYTFLWSGGETTEDISALTVGTYDVTITDNLGCTALNSVQLSYDIPDVTVVADGPATFCQGGSVVLSASGSPGSSFQWQENGIDIPDAVLASYTAVNSADYSVVITNTAGCSAVSNPVTVTAEPVPAATITPSGSVSVCFGGTLQLDAVTGPSFAYQWQLNGTDIPGEITSSYVASASGSYTVLITEGNCSSVSPATVVTVVQEMTAMLNLHQVILFCAGANNGEVTVTAQDGIQPYTYTWVGSASTGPYANDLSVGLTYVTVTDACGTTAVDSVYVTSLPPMESSITSFTDANCAASSDGSATVTTSLGIPPYSYAWSGSASTTNVASDLAVGWQYVTISDFCGSITDSVEISSLPALSITLVSNNNVSCVGNSDGSATVTTVNGVPPFSYLWSNGETGSTALLLTEGWNPVTVTDFCGTVEDSIMTIVNTPLSILISSPSPASCAGGNNGAALVTAYNGSAPITYMWSTGNTNAFATDLIVGYNYVSVTDACTTLVDSVQISSLPPLNASIAFSMPASCPTTPDGKASVNVTNGAPPYSYTWSNSSSTGYIAQDLLPGMNYVTVTDQCTSVVASVNITYLPTLTVASSEISLVSCSGLSDGTAKAVTTNGSVPVTFLWSSGETNDTAVALPQGMNYVTVTDLCVSVVDSVNISVTPPVTASYTKPDGIPCYGQSTASISVTTSNGISPYQFAWADDITTTPDRINLAAGKYYFTVTDACGSSFNDSVTVNQPGPLSLSMITTNVSFTGMSDGAIDLIMSGGTQPYSFAWSNSSTDEDLQGVPADVYYLTVTDDNGCYTTDSASIITDSWHIEIYSAFTPNGDGKNDVWNIKHISAFPECEVTIFDEWGLKVFETKGYTTPWDGKSTNSKPLPAATYYYIIDLKDGSKVFTGSVALIK